MTANNQEKKKEEYQSGVQPRVKRSIGEELFLVHLKRKSPEDDEEDHDEEEKHVRRRVGKSIGEELYQIHLKRSRQGCDKDFMIQNPQESINQSIKECVERRASSRSGEENC